jgi:hypothetical protein
MNSVGVEQPPARNVAADDRFVHKNAKTALKFDGVSSLREAPRDCEPCPSDIRQDKRKLNAFCHDCLEVGSLRT